MEPGYAAVTLPVLSLLYQLLQPPTKVVRFNSLKERQHLSLSLDPRSPRRLGDLLLTINIPIIHRLFLESKGFDILRGNFPRTLLHVIRNLGKKPAPTLHATPGSSARCK
jgi:hypothetical protein